MPQQRPRIGDIFRIPLEDGTFSLGQIVEINQEVLNSITCAFFNVRSNDVDASIPNLFDPISVQFVTKDLFSKGIWTRIDNRTPSISTNLYPYRSTEKEGWVGAKVIGSGIITKFLSAFYGLRNWQEMSDPNYYQNLLCKGCDERVDA